MLKASFEHLDDLNGQNLGQDAYKPLPIVQKRSEEVQCQSLAGRKIGGAPNRVEAPSFRPPLYIDCLRCP